MKVADTSNGYDAAAESFITSRTRNNIGASTVRLWAATVRPDSTVLDLGCGSGIPVTRILIERGCRVSGVDASPTMLAAYHATFPDNPVELAPVQSAACFGRTFDAAIAWGLIFLLSADDQRALIRRVAAVLNPDGRFLFTAPRQIHTWTDVLTGLESVSLGEVAYRQALTDAGMRVAGRYRDEGGNDYFDTRKA